MLWRAGDADGEGFVTLLEVTKKRMPAATLDEVVRAVRSRILRDHKVACDEILVAPPGEILKTTSGKVRRRACREAYLSGELEGRMLRVDSVT